MICLEIYFKKQEITISLRNFYKKWLGTWITFMIDLIKLTCPWLDFCAQDAFWFLCGYLSWKKYPLGGQPLKFNLGRGMWMDGDGKLLSTGFLIWCHWFLISPIVMSSFYKLSVRISGAVHCWPHVILFVNNLFIKITYQSYSFMYNFSFTFLTVGLVLLLSTPPGNVFVCFIFWLGKIIELPPLQNWSTKALFRPNCG